MPTYFNYLFILLLELPFYLLICLLTQLLTYAPHLPTYHYVHLPTYDFYIAKYLINYLLTFPTSHNP
jgi:hypothetical protein